MASYVDGFVVPVPKKNVEAYRRMARKAGKVWIEYGALEVHECVADDVKPGACPTRCPSTASACSGAGSRKSLRSESRRRLHEIHDSGQSQRRQRSRCDAP